jgi:hypothetical protein
MIIDKYLILSYGLCSGTRLKRWDEARDVVVWQEIGDNTLGKSLLRDVYF